MLAVSGGRLVALSTPWGKRGWFHAAWMGDEYDDYDDVRAVMSSEVRPLWDGKE
jgi:hypothetical protein